jgi:hypothetical protein
VALATRGYISVGVSDEPADVDSLTVTSAASIRDRIIALIEALTPTVLPSHRFRESRNEYGGDFMRWAEANPVAAFRRFQVRDTGAFFPPELSNTDLEWQFVTFEILVAYPHDHRAGRQNALDRDDAMAADELLIEDAVGLNGYLNFIDPHPNAAWVSGRTTKVIASACTFLTIIQAMRFYRSQPT